MLLSLVRLTSSRLLGSLVVLSGSSVSKGIELPVLRHEVAVLRSGVPKPRLNLGAVPAGLIRLPPSALSVSSVHCHGPGGSSRRLSSG